MELGFLFYYKGSLLFKIKEYTSPLYILVFKIHLPLSGNSFIKLLNFPIH